MELSYITAGQIVNTHGVRGEVKLLPRGIQANDLTCCGTFYINETPYSCTAARVHKGCLLVKLKGIDDMDAALALKGRTVTVRREEVPLPEGEYFDEELVGLTARDAETGEEIGKIEEVLTYPAHKIYAVRGGKDEYLVPAVPAFVKAVNIKSGTIDIHMLKGLGTHESIQ